MTVSRAAMTLDKSLAGEPWLCNTMVSEDEDIPVIRLIVSDYRWACARCKGLLQWEGFPVLIRRKRG